MAGMDPDVVTRFERETWSRCSPSYLDTFAVLTNEAVPLLVEAANVRRGTRVLEIGTGPGNVAGKLAAVGAAVDAVDFAEPMLEIARRNHPAVRFHQANAEQLPFADGSFDAVVANFVVHHLARPDQVFREVHRVLGPGGRFAFVVWGPPEEQSSISVFFAAVQAHYDLAELPNGPLFGVTDRATYEPLISGAGLRAFQLERHAIAWRAATLDPIVTGFRDWGNLAALAPEVRDRIEATTRANAKPYATSDGYVFPHTVVLGQATRP